MATQPDPHHQSAQADGSTRERLLVSALKLFASKGYGSTSIREIIQYAGVTRPVLYYYFKNKEDLFCSLVETHFAKAYEEMDEVLRKVSGCRERLKAIIRRAFESAEDSPEAVQFLLRYFFAPPDQKMRLDSNELTQERFVRIVAVMQQGLEDGEVCGGDAASLALAFAGFMDLHVMGKARRPERTLRPELGDALVDLFMDGAASVRASDGALRYAFGE